MTNPIADRYGVIVVGGGAAGMMAAITAAELGAKVLMIERNERCGRKLRITGKGRCNLTNDCSVEEFMQNVPTNPKFLYSALGRFDTADTKSFFEDLGVPLKVERGKRVFPVSDKATDVVDALVRKCRRAGVEILTGRVSALTSENGRINGVMLGSKKISASAVILATGGKSYPLTGSEGDGYRLAGELGHTTVTPKPSLVPLTSQDRDCAAMQGLSLKNVELSVIDTRNGRTVFKDFGEMMFTHFGMTGPMILSASSHIKDVDSGAYEALIDLKPALDEQTLDARILSDFAKAQNRDFANVLGALLPQKMIDVVIKRSGIDGRKKVNSITKEERAALLSVIKRFGVRIKGFRPIEEAIITKGGISVKEISPSTMESKLCAGLFFAGEVIDVDAYTGGFNLQIAFSTGVLAGEHAAYFSFE
ncbi:MAG: NAD(P)/FAD-dependent oxidoreductase [Ruminococcaceae bacterium]|nr:NAD(P)/FAD-dependent oxidoreductase [Oscillospiraceae bacterium]